MAVANLWRFGGVFVAVAIAAGVARAEDDVLVNITGPLAGKVGDRVTFDVELVNRSGRNLEKLRVVDYFDAGFHHEASKSPVELKGTIDLAAGTTRRITLEFLLDEPGRQCHRVEILDQNRRFVGGATECVQVAAVAAPATIPPLVTPPLVTGSAAPVSIIPPAPPSAALSLDLEGPQEATSGGVVPYIVTVRNTGNGPAAPAVLAIAWDAGLVPVEASDGAAREPTRITWNLPPLEPGGEARRRLNLQAQSPPTAFVDSEPVRACVRAELAGAGGTILGDQVCLRIRSTTPRPRLRTPAEAGLRLTLADLDDPVRGGDATTLVCTIVNDGSAASGPLSLVVELPRGARVVGDPRARIDSGRVSFDAIDVPAGQRQAFEISYKPAEAGRSTASASVTGANLDGRMDRSCETEFLP